jgi:diadenylate cyclase
MDGARRPAAPSASWSWRSTACARAKIGALFIIQGEIDVLDVVSDRGREINAALQADTLVALVIPHSDQPRARRRRAGPEASASPAPASSAR